MTFFYCILLIFILSLQVSQRISLLSHPIAFITDTSLNPRVVFSHILHSIFKTFRSTARLSIKMLDLCIIQTNQIKRWSPNLFLNAFNELWIAYGTRNKPKVKTCESIFFNIHCSRTASNTFHNDDYIIFIYNRQHQITHLHKLLRC